MILVSLIGALLVLGGVVYLARGAIYRGRMSDPNSGPGAPRTLEPGHRGLRFLGAGVIWPGLLLIAVGTILLLSQFFS